MAGTRASSPRPLTLLLVLPLLTGRCFGQESPTATPTPSASPHEHPAEVELQVSLCNDQALGTCEPYKDCIYWLPANETCFPQMPTCSWCPPSHTSSITTLFPGGHASIEFFSGVGCTLEETSAWKRGARMTRAQPALCR